MVQWFPSFTPGVGFFPPRLSDFVGVRVAAVLTAGTFGAAAARAPFAAAAAATFGEPMTNFPFPFTLNPQSNAPASPPPNYMQESGHRTNYDRNPYVVNQCLVSWCVHFNTLNTESPDRLPPTGLSLFRITPRDRGFAPNWPRSALRASLPT
ncbi:hypothetical protein KTE50_15410 [Burkholderia multivorans]|uniref:hypothetical protein n=1 Tax=Burkholderia multivorans TaxID=87883 RepID=UPI001C256354|nr:hypothetical protein [Burkholderia multivorans]MBU9549933.1 hypothetical protein [Burkholderia multivorans]